MPQLAFSWGPASVLVDRDTTLPHLLTSVTRQFLATLIPGTAGLAATGTLRLHAMPGGTAIGVALRILVLTGSVLVTMGTDTIEATGADKPKSASKPRGRLIELDILRGFLLLWMTLTHLPTKASIISNQTFGFVSGAEGFIFLAGFMMGQLEHHIEQKRGQLATLRDIARRTVRVYLYHCGLLAIAFTAVAHIAVSYHRLALENLLSYYLQRPVQALIAALLLDYRPALLDILPMYVVFLALTVFARLVARRWGWDPVIYVSLTIWAAAQFGLRAWLYKHGDIFGLSVPAASTWSL